MFGVNMERGVMSSRAARSDVSPYTNQHVASCTHDMASLCFFVGGDMSSRAANSVDCPVV